MCSVTGVSRLAAQHLDYFVALHADDRFVVDLDYFVERLDAGAVGGSVFNRRDDGRPSVAVRHVDAEAAVLALYLHILLGERLGVDETRVRVVDGGDEAAQRAVVHLRVVYLALFVAVDLVGRERELHLFYYRKLLRREGQAPLPVRADGLRYAVKRDAEQRADEDAREQMQYFRFQILHLPFRKAPLLQIFHGIHGVAVDPYFKMQMVAGGDARRPDAAYHGLARDLRVFAGLYLRHVRVDGR